MAPKSPFESYVFDFVPSKEEIDSDNRRRHVTRVLDKKLFLDVTKSEINKGQKVLDEDEFILPNPGIIRGQHMNGMFRLTKTVFRYKVDPNGKSYKKEKTKEFV